MISIEWLKLMELILACKLFKEEKTIKLWLQLASMTLIIFIMLYKWQKNSLKKNDRKIVYFTRQSTSLVRQVNHDSQKESNKTKRTDPILP